MNGAESDGLLTPEEPPELRRASINPQAASRSTMKRRCIKYEFRKISAVHEAGQATTVDYGIR